MAEFTKVIRYSNRICKIYNNGCVGCPIDESDEFRNFMGDCDDFIFRMPEEAEKVIMDWVKEHPIKTNKDKFKEVFGDILTTQGWDFWNSEYIEPIANCNFIKGATLLTVEEANQLSKEDLAIGEFWWLRSPGDYSHLAALVNYSGWVNYFGSYVDCIDVVVRPALEIDLKSSNLKIGDIFQFGEYDFKVVLPDKALCTTSIDNCVFRKDYKASDANIYETSDVKKFVDAWFEENTSEVE